MGSVMRVSGAELRPKDRIMHPKNKVKPTDVQEYRHVYTVMKQPKLSPGQWQLRCECKDSDGNRVRISVGPTEVVLVERKGK